jgi:hypothetical protein
MNGIRQLLVAAGLTLGVAASGAAAEGAAYRHGHEPGAAAVRPTLNEGRKWATDEPLRKGMEGIRGRMDASLRDIHENKLSAARYGELAKRVNAELAGIVADCRLEPKADAQLHLVIADISEGVEAMAGKAKKTRRQAGAVKVLAALNEYGAYFDHPGWQPIRH